MYFIFSIFNIYCCTLCETSARLKKKKLVWLKHLLASTSQQWQDSFSCSFTKQETCEMIILFQTIFNVSYCFNFILKTKQKKKQKDKRSPLKFAKVQKAVS